MIQGSIDDANFAALKDSITEGTASELTGLTALAEAIKEETASESADLTAVVDKLKDVADAITNLNVLITAVNELTEKVNQIESNEWKIYTGKFDIYVDPQDETTTFYGDTVNFTDDNSFKPYGGFISALETSANRNIIYPFFDELYYSSFDYGYCVVGKVIEGSNIGLSYLIIGKES